MPAVVMGRVAFVTPVFTSCGPAAAGVVATTGTERGKSCGGGRRGHDWFAGRRCWQCRVGAGRCDRVERRQPETEDRLGTGPAPLVDADAVDAELVGVLQTGGVIGDGADVRDGQQAAVHQ